MIEREKVLTTSSSLYEALKHGTRICELSLCIRAKEKVNNVNVH